MTDREAIQQLVAIYARALDEKDYETIASCFAADAEVEYVSFSAAMTGRDEIMAHMKKALEPLTATQHLFTNFIIELDDAAASLACDVLAQHIAGAGGGAETFLSGGKYQVGLRRTDGRWAFASVVARSVWSVGERDMLPSSG